MRQIRHPFQKPNRFHPLTSLNPKNKAQLAAKYGQSPLFPTGIGCNTSPDRNGTPQREASSREWTTSSKRLKYAALSSL